VTSPLATSHANITRLLATNERYAAVQYALPGQTDTNGPVKGGSLFGGIPPTD